MPPNLRPRLALLLSWVAACLPWPVSAAPMIFLEHRTPQGQTSWEGLPSGLAFTGMAGNRRVLPSRAVDPAAPLRVIVELDAEPAAGARLRGLDAALPRRRLERLRDDLASLAGALPPAPVGPAPRAEITREYTQVFSGAAVTLAPALLPRVRGLPYVRGVFPDDTVRAALEQSVPLIRADRVRNELGGTGAGIRVGIVDTGIDYDHPAFEGGFGPGHRVAGGWDFVNNHADPRDDQGHGTHVAGIVAGNGGGVVGVAPQATLYAFKVLNAQGWGLNSDILAGLERVLDPDGDPATDDAMQVINLSLGGGGNADDPMSVALDHLSAAGVVCVVAAGNQYVYFGITSPGTSRRAITVGASTKQDEIAFFSSRGPAPGSLDLKPDLLAPGVDIVSAALGGGRGSLSGTSMAAPHVAGVAALLRQLDPGWGVEEVKAAMVGTSKSLGLSAFEQGAGRVDAYGAATATFVVTPAHLAYGRIDASVPTWTHLDTLHVVNLSPQPRTVSFPASLSITTGATLAVTPAGVTVAPGDTADVLVQLTVDNARTLYPSTYPVPYPQSEPLGYDAVLVASSGAEQHRVPVAFHKAASLRVRSGSGLEWVTVHDRRPNGFVTFNPGAWDHPPTLLPPGRYDVVASFDPDWTFVVREDVDVNGDVDLLLSPDEATERLQFQNVDERGAPIECDFGSLYLFHTASNWGGGFIGFPFSEVHVSPASSAYNVEWTRTATNFRDRRHTFCGALNGVAASQTLSNRAEDLRHIAIELPRVLAPSAMLLFIDYVPDRIDPGYFGLAYFPIAPITGPLTYEWWLMPAPYPGHEELGSQIRLYPWANGSLDPSAPVLESALLRLDHGWPIEGYFGTFFEPRWFRFGGEHMWLGEGPPVWHGKFSNNPYGIVLAADWPGFLTHPLTDMYGTTALEPDPAFTVSRDGVVVLSDTLRGTGGYSHLGDYWIGMPAAAYTFDVSRPFTVRGLPATLDVSARMDTRLPDPDPPSLRSFQIFADGEAADSIGFATAQDAGVRFRLTDGDAPTPASLSIRAPGAATWTSLEVLRDGDESWARIPPTLSGPVALRLEGTDASGNSLTLTWDPAFLASPTIVADLTAIGADASGGVARLSWRSPGAAGLSFVVERRERAGAWGTVGTTVADAEGGIHYVDPDVQAGHAYGYRSGLASGGTPTYSGELWITIPQGPAFALNGARPNPARAENVVVEFSLPSSSPARLALLDIAGREVAGMDVGSLGPGSHVSRLARLGPARAGIYFLRLSQGGRNLTRRVCVLR